jgi:hypothetical protein
MHEVHPLVEDGNDDRPVASQPDDVVMLAAVDADVLG